MSIYHKSISEKKKASLEFAEDQRETQWMHPSFSLGLFHGRCHWDLIHPYPRQTKEDKEEGDAFLAKLSNFLKENLDPDEVDRTGIIPERVYKGLADLGAFAIKIPKEYGGLGLSQVNYGRAMHLVASYCGSTGVLLSAHQSIGVPQPLKLFGTEEQKKKYFPKFAKGAISAFALTEAEAGSDPRNMSTIATPIENGDYFLLNGEKLWCTNGLIADVIVVMAVTPPKMIKGKERKQITAFILETDTPGIELVHRCQFMGLHGIQNGLMRFKDVKVPKENIILGEGEGLKLALTTLNTGRLTMPAASAGIAKWGVNVARQWANKREQWGANIGEHESIGLKIGDMTATTFAIDAMTWLTSNMADDKKKDIRLEAAIAKYFSTEQCYRIIDEVLQIRGGQGYENAESLKARGMDYWPVERVLRDIRINLIIEGTSEIMHLFIAREALDPHLSKVKVLLGKASLGAKLKAACTMPLEYFKLWLPSLGTVHDMDPRLKRHLNYVQSTSKRLGRYIFHIMLIYQKKLEPKQAILNRIVKIGTELFAMSAACTYADLLMKESKEKVNAVELADLFCKSAKDRIKTQFSHTKHNQDKQQLSIAKNVLDGQYLWMETDIIK